MNPASDLRLSWNSQTTGPKARMNCRKPLRLGVVCHTALSEPKLTIVGENETWRRALGRQTGVRTFPCLCPVNTDTFSRTYRSVEQPAGPNDLVEDVLADTGIQGRQGVVEQVHGSLPVHGPGQAQPLLLAPGEVHALWPQERDRGLVHTCSSE